MLKRICFGAILLASLTFPFIGCSNSEVGSIAITPGSQSLAAGQTAQFTAAGTIGHGDHLATTKNVTNSVTWTSSAPAIATISASGLATAVSAGTTTLTASMSAATSGTATLTVTGTVEKPADELVSLSVIPGSQTLTGVAQTVNFIVIGTTGTGATVNLTNQGATLGSATVKAAVWSSSTPAVATINPATGAAQAVSSGTTTVTAVATNPNGTVVTGSASLTVNISAPGAGEPLVSLAIVPAAQTLTAVSQTASFVVIGTTSSGATVNLTNVPATVGTAAIKAASWTSSNPSVATVNQATGIVTAVSSGTAVITAIAANPDGTVVTATATLTVNITATMEPLVSLAIVPGSQMASVVNQTAQFIAVGTTSSGTTVNLTNQSATIDGVTINAATWGSSSSAVATINPAKGLATAVSSGTAAITAVAKNPDGTMVTGIATFTVTTTPEPLVSLAIVPGTQTLTAAGQLAQFIAIGTTASGATVNLTNVAAMIGPAFINAATWGSSTMQVATINHWTGLATAGSSGITVITAMASNPDGSVVTGTATLTVNILATPEPLVSLAIVPAVQQALAINQTAQFIAIGTTSSGTTVNLTNHAASIGGFTILAASWTSSGLAVATIDPETGVATSVSAGSTAIIAVAENPDGTVVTGTAAYTVTIPNVSEPLVSMAIVPASQTLVLLDQTAHLKAIATTGTGTTVNLTNQTVTIGSATIQPAVWTSSNPGVATVNPGTGVVTALTAGATVITAIASNPVDLTVVTGVSTVTVTATGGSGGTIASISVIPGSQAVQSPNATAQFIAIGTTTTGATADLTHLVAWNSSSANIGTVGNSGNSTGLATAVGQGTATITALYTPLGNGNAVTGTATFTVIGGTSEQFTALTLTPGSESLSASGQTSQLIALAKVGTNGYQQDVTNSPQIKWNSSIPTIASISSSGLATGLSVGTSTITAELTNPDGTLVSATATITASQTPAPEPLLSLAIVPGAITVGNLQDTGQFLAIGTFSTVPYVRDLTNSPGTTWISSFPDSFPVNTNSGGTPSASAGIVTAYGTGTATIVAEATSVDGTIQTATSTFSCPLVLPNKPLTAGSCWTGQVGPLKATLTVYGEGLNISNWLLTAPSATGTPDVIHCGPGWTANGQTGGSVCVGIYPTGSTITLTAPAQTGVAFGGWTYNCIPTQPISATGPNSCQIVLGATNATVGAIFN